MPRGKRAQKVKSSPYMKPLPKFDCVDDSFTLQDLHRKHVIVEPLDDKNENSTREPPKDLPPIYLEIVRKRLSRAQLDLIFDTTDGHCYMCGDRLVRGNRVRGLPGQWEVEHVIAFSKDREKNDRLDNMLPACGPCNARKSDRSIMTCIVNRKLNVMTFVLQCEKVKKHLNDQAYRQIKSAGALKNAKIQGVEGAQLLALKEAQEQVGGATDVVGDSPSQILELEVDESRERIAIARANPVIRRYVLLCSKSARQRVWLHFRFQLAFAADATGNVMKRHVDAHATIFAKRLNQRGLDADAVNRWQPCSHWICVRLDRVF